MTTAWERADVFPVIARILETGSVESGNVYVGIPSEIIQSVRGDGATQACRLSRLGIRHFHQYCIYYLGERASDAGPRDGSLHKCQASSGVFSLATGGLCFVPPGLIVENLRRPE